MWGTCTQLSRLVFRPQGECCCLNCLVQGAYGSCGAVILLFKMSCMIVSLYDTGAWCSSMHERACPTLSCAHEAASAQGHQCMLQQCYNCDLEWGWPGQFPGTNGERDVACLSVAFCLFAIFDAAGGQRRRDCIAVLVGTAQSSCCFDVLKWFAGLVGRACCLEGLLWRVHVWRADCEFRLRCGSITMYQQMLCSYSAGGFVRSCAQFATIWVCCITTNQPKYGSNCPGPHCDDGGSSNGGGGYDNGDDNGRTEFFYRRNRNYPTCMGVCTSERHCFESLDYSGCCVIDGIEHLEDGLYCWRQQ